MPFGFFPFSNALSPFLFRGMNVLFGSFFHVFPPFREYCTSGISLLRTESSG